MKEEHDENRPIERLNALPREMTPQNDVWPRILDRIEHVEPAADTGSQRERFWPVAVAAALVMFVAAGVYINKPWQEAGPVSGAPQVAQNESMPMNQDYFAQVSLVGELEYQAALKEFMALGSSASVNGTRTPEWIESGWKALRQVEIELQTALKSEPDNHFLNLKMATLRDRQIDLLKQIALVDNTSRRMNT
jgi:hypothetical protein